MHSTRTASKLSTEQFIIKQILDIFINDALANHTLCSFVASFTEISSSLHHCRLIEHESFGKSDWSL